MDPMTPGRRLRATYDFRPVDHLVRTEFYIWEEAIAKWEEQGLPDNWAQTNLFNYEPTGYFTTGVNLGWCEPPFLPYFESKIIEATEEYEIIQDCAGRHLKMFKGRRHGFMPDYLKHPVSCMADWNDVALRLDPNCDERWVGLEEIVKAQKSACDAVDGMLSQNLIGAYMYLRALCGPVDLLYMFYDQPDVIHAAMQRWYELNDAAIERVQAITELDEVYVGEDICYNHGLLISPSAFKAFLFPYYEKLLDNTRSRQKKKLNFQVDTDGDCRPAIPLYMELGMTRMSPMEVASGCDVVEIGRQYPHLVMSGGIDKRVLAAGKDAIESHLQHIIPFMVERGGYYPTCDHGVPDDVTFENYMYYRKRMCELDHR